MFLTYVLIHRRRHHRRHHHLFYSSHASRFSNFPHRRHRHLTTLWSSSYIVVVIQTTARTVPGRENGGNCDIKNLSRGCTVYFPVFVDGANLSMGDMHFSQGDGEVSFCGAIEMSGFIDLKCTVIKGGMKILPGK